MFLFYTLLGNKIRFHCDNFRQNPLFFFMRKLNNNTALLQKTIKLRSFNSQLHSELSVVGYHDHGLEIGKYWNRNQSDCRILRIPPDHDQRNK